MKVKFEFRRYLDAPEYTSETTRLGKGISIPISSTSQVMGTEVGSSPGRGRQDRDARDQSPPANHAIAGAAPAMHFTEDVTGDVLDWIQYGLGWL